VLRGNAIVGNLRFALESNSSEPIDAGENWWGRTARTPEHLRRGGRCRPRAGADGPALAAPPVL